MLGAMSSALTSFENADSALAPDQMMRLHRLRQKIPAQMRGMFGLIIEERQLKGIELLPNAATAVMNSLAVQAGKEPRSQADHSPTQTQRWTGNEFDTILEDPFSRLMDGHTTHRATVYARTKEAQARDDYMAQGLFYRATTDLTQLLWHGGFGRDEVLPHAEQRLLERVANRIPKELHDAFVVDLVDGPKGLSIGAIGIDPNILCNRIALELMEPILAPESSFMREPSQRAGIRAHNYAYMLDREAMETIANGPAAGRRRG